MGKCVPYVLEKDGELYAFPSEKAAGEFLGVKKGTISGSASAGTKVKGYIVRKAKSEWDIYYNKRLWKIWQSMHERCEYKRHMHYDSYGGRGIKVCDEWDEYVPFAKWALKNGYSETLTLDRIDNDGNYMPKNCRWVTVKAQMNNKRTNRRLEYLSKTYTLTELSEYVGINKTTLRERLETGMSVEEAVNKPIRKRKRGFRPSKGYGGK